ncbi:MAG TPA: OmpA family protein [Pseudomonas sp.]|nr:OmpA family protein [Pseudomonas sp.]
MYFGTTMALKRVYLGLLPLAFCVGLAGCSTEPIKESVPVQAEVAAKPPEIIQEIFARSLAVLTPYGEEQVREMAREMKIQKDAMVPSSEFRGLVVGHSDSSGIEKYNQRLSDKRARVAAGLLVEAGIDGASIYYRGAGSLSPVATNATEAGRAANRRVEMLQVEDEWVIMARATSKAGDPEYLDYLPKSVEVEVEVSEMATQDAIPEKPAKPVPLKIRGKGGINFGGNVADTTHSRVTPIIAPKKSFFRFATSSHDQIPELSCIADMLDVPNVKVTEVGGQFHGSFNETEYLPGMDGRPWAQIINGHLASFGPVSILKDDSELVRQAYMEFIANYNSNKKAQSGLIKAVAKTYDGQDHILYRVYTEDIKTSPVACMDVVFDKRTGEVVGGELFYPRNGTVFVVEFQPRRQ